MRDKQRLNNSSMFEPNEGEPSLLSRNKGCFGSPSLDFSGSSSNTAQGVQKQGDSRIIEYRRIIKDMETSDELIMKRIEYLEALCRNIIKIELENYVLSEERKQRQ